MAGQTGLTHPQEATGDQGPAESALFCHRRGKLQQGLQRRMACRGRGGAGGLPGGGGHLADNKDEWNVGGQKMGAESSDGSTVSRGLENHLP